MKNLFVILILLASLGCTKLGKNITVKGRVLNPITGQGIEGVELKLIRGTLELPGGEKSVKSTTTDANGDFEISKFGLNSYDLQCNIGDYYPIGWYEDGEKANGTLYRLNVRKRKTMHADFHAVEYGNLNLTIQNINCQGPADTLILYQSSQYDEDAATIPWFHNVCAFWNGTSKIPMGTYYYHWLVQRNGITTEFWDTVFYSGNQTQNYSILY